MEETDSVPEEKQLIHKISDIVKIILVDALVVVLIIFLVNAARPKNDENVNAIQAEILAQKDIDEKLNNMGGTLFSPSVVVDPYNASPLSAAVIFDTEQPASISATIIGQNGAQDLTLVYPIESHHVLELPGLFNGSNEVVFSDGINNSTVFINTELGDVSYSCGNPWVFNYIDGWSNAYICDESGNVRWYSSRVSRGTIIQLNSGLILSSTNQSLSDELISSGLFIQDFLGKIYKEYRIAGGYFNGLAELPDGNILAGGSVANNKERNYDLISVINRDSGNVEKEFWLDSLFAWKITGVENFSYADWFHISDIAFNSDTRQIAVVGSIAKSVLNIDFDTGNCSYALGTYSNYNDLGPRNEDGWYSELSVPSKVNFYDGDVVVKQTLPESGDKYLSYHVDGKEYYSYESEYSERKVWLDGFTIYSINYESSIVGSQFLIEPIKEKQRFVDAHAIDDFYKSKNIIFSLHGDKICVSANFDGTGISKYEIKDDVKVILAKDFITYTYALDNTLPRNYLSINGLDGTYKIYVELNEKLYDTKKTIRL